MKQFKILNIVSILTIAFFSACTANSTPENEEGHQHGVEHQEEDHTMVSITKMQAKTIGLKVGPLMKIPLSNTVKVTGMLELFPQDRAEVSPLLGGNVKSIHVVEGDEITKGQLLATMEHPRYIQMQQEYQMKYSSLAYLKEEYERQERLNKENISSAKEYQLAKSQYFAAKAEVNGLKTTLQMLGLDVSKITTGKIFSTIPITAPISGFLHLVNINLGEFAGPQMGRKQVMFEITDNARLHADFRVYEKDIYKVKKGQKVYFTVANHPNKILEATIDAVGKAFEDNPKSIHLHADITNKDKKLLPGMYLEGKIATDNNLVTAVPEEAIVTEGEKTFIFVHLQTEKALTFKKVEVVLGVHDNGNIEIKLLQPLLKNTTIVLAGAYMLSSEMIKGELEHED